MTGFQRGNSVPKNMASGVITAMDIHVSFFNLSQEEIILKCT